MVRRLAAWMALMVAAAGCLGGGSEGFDAVETEAPLVLPPGCDASRPAVVHGPDGLAADWDGPVGLPCHVVTAWGTGEPSLGVTGDGSLFLYPAYQAPTEEAEAVEQFTGLGIARSSDEGAAFDRLFSEVGPVNFHPYTADPFMYVDPYTDRVFMEDLAAPPFNCANLSFSDDGGDSWTQTLGGCLVWDHVGYGSGPATVSDPSYPVVLQRCAITYVMTTLVSEASGCQKSLDGGMTWEPPGDPAFLFGPDGLPYAPGTCHGAVHHVFVDHRGWTWLGRGWCGDPYVALSKDEGATWQRFKIADLPVAGHDVGVGVDAAGTVYAFWVAAEDTLPYLAVSHDDGATWSEPMMVGPPGITGAGSISIAPGGVGKAGLTYAAQFGDDEVHAVVAAGYRLDTDAPVFQSALATAPGTPLATGSCAAGTGTCTGQADFLDATVGPDGTVWGSFVHEGKLSGGRLWGAPSLWDEGDPDGVYGGWT